MPLERTLGIIKPDAVAKGHVGEILNVIHQNGFHILGMRMRRIAKREAEAFYAIHKERAFFAGLVAFMSEAPVVVLVLEREDAIAKWRQVMGATNPADAADGTIRKRFAQDIERNSVHGSDSPETALQEIPFFFTTAELL